MIVLLLAMLFLLCLMFIIIGLGKANTSNPMPTALLGWWIAGVVSGLLCTIALVVKIGFPGTM